MSAPKKKNHRRLLESEAQANGAFRGLPNLVLRQPLSSRRSKTGLKSRLAYQRCLAGGETEWETDLLFKKPFTLSDKVEFMIGVGPAWSFSREGTKITGEVRSILCSGRHRIASSGGFSNQATATLSVLETNNHLA